MPEDANAPRDRIGIAAGQEETAPEHWREWFKLIEALQESEAKAIGCYQVPTRAYEGVDTSWEYVDHLDPARKRVHCI